MEHFGVSLRAHRRARLPYKKLCLQQRLTKPGCYLSQLRSGNAPGPTRGLPLREITRICKLGYRKGHLPCLRRRGPGPHATSHEVKPGKKNRTGTGEGTGISESAKAGCHLQTPCLFPAARGQGLATLRLGTRRRGGRPGDLISDQRNLAPWGGRTGTERTGPDRNESDRIESWTLPDAGNPCPSDALSRVSQGSDRESVRSVYHERRETARDRESERAERAMMRRYCCAVWACQSACAQNHREVIFLKSVDLV